MVIRQPATFWRVWGRVCDTGDRLDFYRVSVEAVPDSVQLHFRELQRNYEVRERVRVTLQTLDPPAHRRTRRDEQPSPLRRHVFRDYGIHQRPDRMSPEIRLLNVTTICKPPGSGRRVSSI